jgi:hypothetical protein
MVDEPTQQPAESNPPASAPEPPKADPELVSWTTRSEKPGDTQAIKGNDKG